MVTTVLEARVEQERWDVLRAGYQEAVEKLPAQIAATSLLQDTSDRVRWRIVTFWKSMEALQQVRGSVETPAGVLVFRNAGAEPTLTVFDVVTFASNLEPAANERTRAPAGAGTNRNSQHATGPNSTRSED